MGLPHMHGCAWEQAPAGAANAASRAAPALSNTLRQGTAGQQRRGAPARASGSCYCSRRYSALARQTQPAGPPPAQAPGGSVMHAAHAARGFCAPGQAAQATAAPPRPAWSGRRQLPRQLLTQAPLQRRESDGCVSPSRAHQGSRAGRPRAPHAAGGRRHEQPQHAHGLQLHERGLALAPPRRGRRRHAGRCAAGSGRGQLGAPWHGAGAGAGAGRGDAGARKRPASNVIGGSGGATERGGGGAHALLHAQAAVKQSSLGAGRGRLGRASQRCSSKRGAPRCALACAGWRCRPKGAAGALLLLTTLPPEASNSGSSLEQWRFMGQRRRAAAACTPSGAGQSMEGTRQAEVASSLAPAQGVRRPKVYGASSCPMRMPQKLGQAGRRPREAGNAGAAAAQQLALHSRARVGRRAKRKHALGTPPPIGVQRHGDGCQPNTSARGGDQQTNAPCQAPCNESDL